MSNLCLTIEVELCTWLSCHQQHASHYISWKIKQWRRNVKAVHPQPLNQGAHPSPSHLFLLHLPTINTVFLIRTYYPYFHPPILAFCNNYSFCPQPLSIFLPVLHSSQSHPILLPFLLPSCPHLPQPLLILLPFVLPPHSSPTLAIAVPLPFLHSSHHLLPPSSFPPSFPSSFLSSFPSSCPKLYPFPYPPTIFHPLSPPFTCPLPHSIQKGCSQKYLFKYYIFPNTFACMHFPVVWHCRDPVHASQPRWQIIELLGTGSDWPPWHVFSKQMVVSYYKSASVTPSSSFIAAYVFSVPLYHSVKSSCIYDNKNCPLTSTL